MRVDVCWLFEVGFGNPIVSSSSRFASDSCVRLRLERRSLPGDQPLVFRIFSSMAVPLETKANEGNPCRPTLRNARKALQHDLRLASLEIKLS